GKTQKTQKGKEKARKRLCSLRDFLKDVNPGFNSFLKLVANLRELLENFFCQMRSRNDMPTALEFAYLFAPTIRESLKQLTDTGFVYYTSPHSYCEVPHEMKLPFRDLPSLSVPSSVEMAKDGQRLMRDWRDSFDDLTARETVVTAIEREAVRGAILFEANSVVVVKHDHIRGYPNRRPFFVGIVVADVTDKAENYFCDIELFVSAFEDWCDFVKLTEVSYETFLRYQNDVEDLLPDKEGGEEDSDLDSDDDENPADVVFGGMPLRTTSGRTVV
ncbi:unnamed protein product, partial [Porites lobata]